MLSSEPVFNSPATDLGKSGRVGMKVPASHPEFYAGYGSVRAVVDRVEGAAANPRPALRQLPPLREMPSVGVHGETPRQMGQGA